MFSLSYYLRIFCRQEPFLSISIRANLLIPHKSSFLHNFLCLVITKDKNTFSYDSMKNVDYAELKKSEKFTPALYHEKNGIWEGGSISQFSPVMTFKLWEKFSDSCLEVSESMEVNGKRTFGYDEPIIYKRV